MFSLLTFGDGYHNNHHCHPSSARTDFFEGEFDLTYWVIRQLERCGLIWDVKISSPAHGTESKDTSPAHPLALGGSH